MGDTQGSCPAISGSCLDQAEPPWFFRAALSDCGALQIFAKGPMHHTHTSALVRLLIGL